MASYIRIQIAEAEKDGGTEQGIVEIGRKVLEAIEERISVVRGGVAPAMCTDMYSGKAWYTDIILVKGKRTLNEIREKAETIHKVGWIGEVELNYKK